MFLQDRIWKFFEKMKEESPCARLCLECFKLFWGTDSCEKEKCNDCLNKTYHTQKID